MGEILGTNSSGDATNRMLSRRRMLGVSGLAVLGATGCRDVVRGPGEDTGQNPSPGRTRTQPGRTEGPGRTTGPGRTAEPGRTKRPVQASVRVAPPAPVGILGANFNGDPSNVTWAELEDIGATWLRGFFPMRDADGVIAGKPQISRLLAAGERGYGTVLSLKFPYNDSPIPTPGTEAWSTAFARLDRVLPVVMGKVDILVIGNEPFIESRAEDRDERLNVFYERLAQRVITYRSRNAATSTRLYMGALNHRAAWRTPATNRWLNFVANTRAISGVDIHPHLAAPGGAQRYLGYVLPLMRPGQTFLVTEFSLVHLWKAHLTDPVSPAFATRYPKERGKQVWRVLRGAVDRPFSQKKWDDFLAMHAWFRNNDTYLRDQVAAFRSTGRLAVATYGVSQDADMASDFTAQSTPWLLNSVFCPYTVKQGTDGLPGRNRAWANQFRALQNT